MRFLRRLRLALNRTADIGRHQTWGCLRPHVMTVRSWRTLKCGTRQLKQSPILTSPAKLKIQIELYVLYDSQWGKYHRSFLPHHLSVTKYKFALISFSSLEETLLPSPFNIRVGVKFQLRVHVETGVQASSLLQTSTVYSESIAKILQTRRIPEERLYSQDPKEGPSPRSVLTVPGRRETRRTQLSQDPCNTHCKLLQKM